MTRARSLRVAALRGVFLATLALTAGAGESPPADPSTLALAADAGESPPADPSTLTLMAGAGESPPADPSTEVARGELLFRLFCVNCHGASAKGDGPTAEFLRIAPADLTRLRSRDGTFLAERVYRQIDGRDVVPGHGQRRMPIWGLGFQDSGRVDDQEAEVRSRIRSLVEYLRSIQQPPP